MGQYREYLVKGLYSVDHIIKEVANSIWKHTIIFKRFTIENCKDAYQVLNRLIKEEVILIEDQSKYLDKAMDIAIKNKISVYDSLYIAQSLKYGELLTSDETQGKIARKLGVKVYYIR